MASLIPEADVKLVSKALSEWNDRGLGLSCFGNEVFVGIVCKGGLSGSDERLTESLRQHIGIKSPNDCDLVSRGSRDLFLYVSVTHFHKIPLAVQFLLDRNCAVELSTKLKVPRYCPGDQFDFNRLEERYLGTVKYLLDMPHLTSGDRIRLFWAVLKWYLNGNDQHLCFNPELWETPEGKSFHSLLLSTIAMWPWNRKGLPKPLLTEEWFLGVCIRHNIIHCPLLRCAIPPQEENKKVT